MIDRLYFDIIITYVLAEAKIFLEEAVLRLFERVILILENISWDFKRNFLFI